MQLKTNAGDINPKSIPESAITDLAKGILEVAKKAQAMPGVMERYEQWKQERNRREK